VGLLPLEPVLMAAEYALHVRGVDSRPLGEDALIAVAHDYLGLSDFTPFDPARKIIEHAIR
jgi:hypothetical protein